jgi:hypothetical protein
MEKEKENEREKREKREREKEREEKRIINNKKYETFAFLELILIQFKMKKKGDISYETIKYLYSVVVFVEILLSLIVIRFTLN